MKSRLGFLLYDSRSGSTFLTSKLEKLQDCFVTNESDFVSRILFYKDNINANLIDFLFKDIRFVDLKVESEELKTYISTKNPNAKELIEYILLAHLKQRYHFFEDKVENIIIIKHPPIGDFSSIRHLWEDVRYFLIVRDGRDVHLSKYNSINLNNKRFSTNVLSSALNWKTKQNLFLQYVNPSDIFKYEELISQEDIYTFIAKKIGTLATLDNRKEFPLPISQKGFHSNVNKGILSSNKKKYDEDSYVNFIFCLIARKVLLEYGYSTLYKFNFSYTLKLLFEFINLALSGIKNILKYILTDRYLLKTKLSKMFKK
ncbi:MAG: hypothetical protein R2760_06790 [Chitinophagales bacterium]